MTGVIGSTVFPRAKSLVAVNVVGYVPSKINLYLAPSRSGEFKSGREISVVELETITVLPPLPANVYEALDVVWTPEAMVPFAQISTAFVLVVYPTVPM